MSYQLIINQILTLFIIILIGYILKEKGYMDKKLEKGLSRLLINIILPSLIISSMIVELNKNLLENIRLIAIISIIAYITLILFVKIIMNFLSLTSNRKTVFEFMLIFGNVGYMGYPIIKAIYPEYGILYAVFNNIVFNLLMWTYGIYLFTNNEIQDSIQWKNILNNGLIASFIGLVLIFTGYRPPQSIAGALSSLGNMTFPLSMLIIGASLAKIKFKAIFQDSYLFLLGFIRLLILPVITLLILKQFNLPDIVVNIPVILIAMPAAANAVIFAEEFDNDKTFASEGVFFTTLMSLATIPFIIYLIKL